MLYFMMLEVRFEFYAIIESRNYRGTKFTIVTQASISEHGRPVSTIQKMGLKLQLCLIFELG